MQTHLYNSNSTLNVNGTFAIGGVNLTATVSSLNAIVDISGGAGYVVVSGTNVYKEVFLQVMVLILLTMMEWLVIQVLL